MGFFKDFKEYRKQKRALASTDPYSPRQGIYEIWSGNNGNPMSIATVYRCVTILSETVAKLRMQSRTRRNRVMVPEEESDLSYLLGTSPNPQMSAFTFWSYFVQDLYFRGNAYVIPQYSSGKPRIINLWRVNPDGVTPDIANGKYVITDTTTGNVIQTVNAEEIIHVVGMPSRTQPGVGVSVIQYAREAIETQRAGDRETRKRFMKGGNQQVVISNDASIPGYGKHQKEALDSVASLMERGINEERRFISLPGDLKLNTVSLSSADMQFLESRKFGVLEICRFFGVPPQFVFADTASNYKSVDMAMSSFRTETLDPLLTKIECEFRRKLVPRSLIADRTFTFDRTGLYAADMLTQIDFVNKAVGIGVKTPNEARMMFDMPPVEGGDDLLLSANLKSLATLRSEGNMTTNNNQDDEE